MRARGPRPDPSHLAAPPGKGACDPPAPSFPIRAEGCTRARRLPFPWPRRPVRPERGHARYATPRPLPIRVEWGRAKARHAERGHARARDPSAHPFLPHSRGRGATRAHRPASPRRPRPRPLPLPSPRRPPPPSLFAPPRSRGKGAREARHPPAPPFSPWPRRPVRAGNARARHPRFHPPPFARRPVRAGRGHATPGATLPPFARKGIARGYAAPGTSLPPWPRRPVRARRGQHEGIRAKGGAHGHAAPFAREWAHEAKPCPPPHVSRSGARAVSVRPRSPRPRFARHSTT